MGNETVNWKEVNKVFMDAFLDFDSHFKQFIHYKVLIDSIVIYKYTVVKVDITDTKVTYHIQNKEKSKILKIPIEKWVLQIDKLTLNTIFEKYYQIYIPFRDMVTEILHNHFKQLNGEI